MEAAARPKVQPVLVLPTQQEQYTKLALHFKKFRVPQLKAIVKSLNPLYIVSYNITKQELVGILCLLAAPADLCARYLTPSDVIIPPKISPVESSKSGPGLGYWSYMRELQRGPDDMSDFWYFVPRKQTLL